MSDLKNAFEYYFLSSCYNEEITEEKVYELFIEKVISSLKIPFNSYISDFQTLINREYSIDIPPTMIKKILKKISRNEPQIELKRDYIKIKNIPIEIDARISELQKKADNDSSTIFRSFNTYLENSGRDRINFADFNTILQIYHKKIVGESFEGIHENELLFFEWCNRIFNSQSENELQAPLNKIIYSWIIYYYYQSIKRQNKKLTGFNIFIDTNIITYLLGVNGDERKNYVKYLILKASQNNCTVIVLDRTINEINRLFGNSPDPAIYAFKNSNKDIVQQLKDNPIDFLQSFFQSYGVPCVIQQYKPHLSSNAFDEIRNGITREKMTNPRKIISEQSILHDVRLLETIGINEKINNIYEKRIILVTTDDHLVKFAMRHLQDKFDSTSTNILTLEKANFILWIESDKARKDHFSGNTWLYVSESLGYFHENRIDELYRKFRKRIYENNFFPESWRSPYLVMKREILDIKKEVDSEEIDLDVLVDRLNNSNEAQIKELKDQKRINEASIRELQKRNKDLEAAKMQSVNQTVIVNKDPDDLGLFHLLKLVLKKMFWFFFNK